MVTLLTILVVILLAASHCHRIILKPPVLTFDEDVTFTNLSVTCDIPPSWRKYDIIRVEIHQSGRLVVNQLRNDTPVLIVNLIGARTERDVNGFVTLIITNVTCKFDQYYTCILTRKMDFNAEGRHDGDKKKPPILVVPGKRAEMTVYPVKQDYSLNDVVNLSCSGLVGSDNILSEIDWTWEYMDYQTNVWTEYTDSNITVDPPISIGDNCQNLQTTIITRSLTLEDNRRIYRCYLTWKGVVHTGNTPIYVFFVSAGTTDTRMMIGVGAAAGAVMLCLAIGTVVCLVRRSKIIIARAKENKDLLKQDGKKSSHLTNNAAQGMKTLLNSGTMFHNENELASNRLTVEDVTEGASSVGSVSSQGTIRYVHQ